MTEEIRVLVKRYIYLGSWFIVRRVDRSITVEQFETVLDEIGRVETELLDRGMPDYEIDRIISFINEYNLSGKPLSSMTEVQQWRLINRVFLGEPLWRHG